MGALDVARAGGRHAGFLRNYEGRTRAEITRAVAPIERRIAEHRDKIAYPERHIPNWSSLDPRQQQALVRQKWPSDIQRQEEQAEILRRLLGELP